MNTLGIKEFQQQASKISQRVQEGETFVILSRSKPVMKLSPVEDGEWEPLVDFTEFKKGGIKLDELLSRL